MNELIGRIVKVAISGGELLDFEVTKITQHIILGHKQVVLSCVEYGCPSEIMSVEMFLSSYGV